MYTIPKSNIEFWKSKLEKNRNRDKRNYEALLKMGLRVIVVWECELRNKKRIPFLIAALSEEIRKGSSSFVEFPPLVE